MRLRRHIGEAALGVAVATAILSLLWGFGGSPVLRNIETAALDWRFRIRGAVPPGNEITIVLVDDASLARFGRWPFSRHLFARAVSILDAAGARVIAFDLLFTEADQAVAPEIRDAARDAVAVLPADHAATRTLLARLGGDDPDGDFAAAIARSGKVLMPFGFAFQGPDGHEPDYLAQAGYVRFDKSPVAPSYPLQPRAIVGPIPRLAAQAAGFGHVAIAFDSDGAPRYDYLAVPFDGDFLPSLPVRAAAAYLGVPWAEVGLAPGHAVEIGPITIPTDTGSRRLIDYRGPRGTFRTVSFADLLDGRAPADALRGRLVLIGASFIGDADSYRAPLGDAPLPGTERLAAAIDNILHRDFLRAPSQSWTLPIAIAVLLLAGMAAAGIALLPTPLGILVGPAPALAWLAAAQWAFARGWWLPVTAPAAALAGSSAAVILHRYWMVGKEGRRIKTAFRHYLAPDMVELIAAHPERLRLGGETREMTVMFCDIRGFTAISEALKSDPQALTHLINRFLTPMSRIITDGRGTIDKFIGDCIMAFWNAPLADPDHADHACACALAMIEGLAELNTGLAAEAGDRPFTRLRIGVGLNTGDCVVGNMGSDQRFDYSVLGDTVNLAARFEGQSKTYGVDIVIGEATRARLAGWATLELDLITVKGKREAVRIFGLLGDRAHAETPEFRALAQCHDGMLERYRAGDWAGAGAAIARCRGLAPRLAALYDLYENRIAEFSMRPTEGEWHGIFVAPSK